VTAPTTFPFKVEALGDTHVRKGFSCGVESLDRYFQNQASQDMRRKAAAVFVLVGSDDPRRVLGYVTLSAFAVDQGSVPAAARKHIPRYPLVSATLIGRLAVDSRCRSKGYGSLLLGWSLRKACENAAVVGSCMVVVEALDEPAVRFYEAHCFIRLEDPRRLIIPMRTIEARYAR
jgi:GNAT superfamily N-acetyltransferase